MMTEIHAKPSRTATGSDSSVSGESRKRTVEKGDSGLATTTDKKKKDKKKALKRL